MGGAATPPIARKVLTALSSGSVGFSLDAADGVIGVFQHGGGLVEVHQTICIHHQIKVAGFRCADMEQIPHEFTAIVVDLPDLFQGDFVRQASAAATLRAHISGEPVMRTRNAVEVESTTCDPRPKITPPGAAQT